MPLPPVCGVKTAELFVFCGQHYTSSASQAFAQGQTSPWDLGAATEESKAQERRQAGLFWTVTSTTFAVKWLRVLLQSTNNNTPTFYSSALLCWKDWVWPNGQACVVWRLLWFMAALRRVQVAPGELGSLLQMSAGCSRQVWSCSVVLAIPQHSKSAANPSSGAAHVTAWGRTTDVALFALNRIKMRNKNAAFDSSLILNRWCIKCCFLGQWVNYETSFHCILFIGMDWIIPPCCAPHLSGLAFILAQQPPLCNILIHIAMFLSANPCYQADILREPLGRVGFWSLAAEASFYLPPA